MSNWTLSDEKRKQFELIVSAFINIKLLISNGNCFEEEEDYENLMIEIDLFKSACRDMYSWNNEKKNKIYLIL